MNLTINVLVTDKSARVVDLEDDERLRDAIYEVVKYDRCKNVEVRTLTIAIDLLAPPPTVEVKPVLVVTADIENMLKAVLQKQKWIEAEQAWDMIMDALPAGTYEVEKSPGMRGMRKIK